MSMILIVTQIRQSLRYSELRDSVPLRPILRSFRVILCCQVVSYALPKSRKRSTACCLCTKFPGDVFWDSSGCLSRYRVVWGHTGLCLVSQIFQGTRRSEYQSSILEACIGSCVVQLVYWWISMVLFFWFVDQDYCCCSPLMRGNSAEVLILLRIFFRIPSVSSWGCFNKLL